MMREHYMTLYRAFLPNGDVWVESRLGYDISRALRRNPELTIQRQQVWIVRDDWEPIDQQDIE